MWAGVTLGGFFVEFIISRGVGSDVDFGLEP